jgi:hypothetical protein
LAVDFARTRWKRQRTPALVNDGTISSTGSGPT